MFIDTPCPPHGAASVVSQKSANLSTGGRRISPTLRFVHLSEIAVNHFVNLLGGAVRSVSRDAMEVLCRYSWPGNVRQLRNVIERLVIMSDHDVINVEDLPAELREERFRGEGRPTTDSGTVTLSLADVENRHLMSVLRDCGGNKSCAARMLGISRSTLYEKLKGLGGEGE